jgi:hypothetical protein
MDQLVQSRGITALSKAQVSEVSKDRDAHVRTPASSPSWPPERGQAVTSDAHPRLVAAIAANLM